MLTDVTQRHASFYLSKELQIYLHLFHRVRRRLIAPQCCLNSQPTYPDKSVSFIYAALSSANQHTPTPTTNNQPPTT